MNDLRIGVLGLNEGNGHPFSYSAIFNGYDPDALATRCPFGLIREYLPREHRNEVFVSGARVTHVWTQDRTLSEDVAAVAKIPNIVTDATDMIGNVDAVLLARDDPANHLAMARPFLEAGIPLFIDKQLTSTPEDLETLLSLAAESQVLMAGSPMRYTRDVARAKQTLADGRTVRSIHGVSRVSWLRYGHHLFEGVAVLFGTDVEWVRSLSARDGHDIVQLRYTDGLNVILEFIRDVSLPISFRCFSDEQPPLEVPFEDFFYSFHHMLAAFVRYVRTGEAPIPREEIVALAKIVLAGDLSRAAGGAPFCPKSLCAVEAPH